jgi:uncharacterized protein
MDATLVRLRVSPGAARTGIVGPHGDGWKIRVAAAPERGRANEAVLDALADSLALSRDAVRIVSGTRGRDKIVEVAGIDRAQVDARLGSAVGGKKRA